MTIEKGQFAALVGASGCGKTNVLSLLERFYEPERGQTFCNGMDIPGVDVYTFRRHLCSARTRLLTNNLGRLLGCSPATHAWHVKHTIIE